MSICPGELIDPASKRSISLYAGLWNSCSLAIWAFIVLSLFIGSDSSEIKSTTWRLRIEIDVMRWRADLKEWNRQLPSPGTKKAWKSFVESAGRACAALSLNCLTTRGRLESDGFGTFFYGVDDEEDAFLVEFTELFVLDCFLEESGFLAIDWAEFWADQKPSFPYPANQCNITSFGRSECKWLSVCPGAKGIMRRCFKVCTRERPTKTVSALRYIFGHNWRSSINLLKKGS